MSVLSRYWVFLPRYIIALALITTFGALLFYSDTISPFISNRSRPAAAQFDTPQHFKTLSELPSPVDWPVSTKSPQIHVPKPVLDKVDHTDPFDITRQVFHGMPLKACSADNQDHGD